MITCDDKKTLINRLTGELAFSVANLHETTFHELQRLNYYSCIWILEGSGRIQVDFSSHQFHRNSQLFFAPYQPFLLIPQKSLKGIIISFHPDFFCIEKHKDEVACNGVLFNNVFDTPLVQVPDREAAHLGNLIEKMRMEMEIDEIAQYDILISYLKIFLITTSRLKISQSAAKPELQVEGNKPFVLQKLKDLIELNYKKKRSPSDYAAMLNVSLKSLGKITKQHFNKTISSIIQERVVIEAKRELYLSEKSVKEIAFELGFEDEYYFSRFFKNVTSISPQYYRETVGFGKAS